MAKQKQRPALTDKQRNVLNFISQYIAKHDKSPSVFEIGATFEIASRAVDGHLDALTKKGYITKEFGVPRSIKVL